MAQLLLAGPALPRVRCPLCSGRGLVALVAYRLPRTCPTCSGTGLQVVDDRWADGFDFRASQLGLAPRIAALEGPHHASGTREVSSGREATGGRPNQNPSQQDTQ